MSNRRLDRLPGFALLAGAIGLASAALLLGALAFEHGAGLAPCPLCLDQRGPHAAAAILAVTAASLAPLARQAARIPLAAAALVLLIGAGIAAYHSGIERRWWAGPESCGAAFALPTSPAEFAAALSRARVVRCDVVPWSLFGLSLANYNTLISAALGLAGGIAAMRRPR